MNRRTLLKSALAAFAGLGVSKPAKLLAGQRHPKRESCKIVVFAADALRIDLAQEMHTAGAPGLSALNPPICALSGGGLSVTQPGWASIWTGMPSYYHKVMSNTQYSPMPRDYHIMKKMMNMFEGDDFYAGWVTGKGGPLKGNEPDSPHYQVYAAINFAGHQGVYHGDKERENAEVYHLAGRALEKAVQHEKFCCFIHFREPDHVGHVTQRYAPFVEQAVEVDQYIASLMTQLPPDTDIIYCSDHGFNFEELGEVPDSHQYAPRGMVATNFATHPYDNVTRETVGRWIYTCAGGNPGHCLSMNKPYAMYGVDFFPS